MYVPETLPLGVPAPPLESNGMAESFVKTFKRDYRSMHELKDATTVME